MKKDEILNMPAGKKMDQLIWWKIFDMTPTPLNNDMNLLPDYSTDIAAAWKVVEKFESRGWAWEIYNDLNSIACEFNNVQGVLGNFHANGGSSVPLAICRAALLAVQS